MSVDLRTFARLDGAEIREAVLESEAARVSILSLGCILRDWRVAAAGNLPVTLGFDALEPYLGPARSFGIVAGRVANRIAQARFPLEGRMVHVTASEPPHALHGGATGLGGRIWDMEADAAACAVRLSYRSPDGEEGFPGAVDFSVAIRLDGATLTYEMEGRPDRPTPINLAQHSYWNLDGGGDALGHLLRMEADACTPTGPDLIPTGDIGPVAGGPADFREARTMTGPNGAPTPLDLNLVLREGLGDRPAAVLDSPRSRLRLELRTDRPGLQLYNAPTLSLDARGHDGARYGPYAGICLEPQGFPDAVNRPGFPSILHDPDRPYRQRLALTIA
jgi:aldose 1-epimerase